MEAVILIIGVIIVAGIIYYLNYTPSSNTIRPKSAPGIHKFVAFHDKYKTLNEVQDALRVAGLESSNLIIGIDYTKSNLTSGLKTFGYCMHEISHTRMNPYQQVIRIIGKTLEVFDDDKLIPAYGFGDVTTTNKSVFPFFVDRACKGFEEVESRYKDITPKVTMAGPTNFGPIIREAITIVRELKAYHILVIIADGQISNEDDTRNAIIEASNYPLSIIVIGVGDGPWNLMRDFDDGLPTRKFDNFQFVDFHSVTVKSKNIEVDFAMHALMEIPDQFKVIHKLKML